MEKNLNYEINEKLNNNSNFIELINSQKSIMKTQLEKEIEFRNTLLNELFE